MADVFIVVQTDTYSAAFALDESNDLIETVDFKDQNGHRVPDWDQAGPCDPARGSDPDLQEKVRATLDTLHLAYA